MPTVETNGIETYYERLGEGPPVVFVHGAAADRNGWRPQIDALAEAYTVVAYDVRGHGLTGPSARERYSIELFADDLAALIDALDLDSPVVCGHSMGGCIAQVHASRRPDDVAGLVLADTFTPQVISRSDWLQRKLLLAAMPPARLVGFERVEKAKNWLHERFRRGAAEDYENVAALREEGATMSTAEFAKTMRAVATFGERPIDYTRITAPTLVLHGENDLGFIGAHADELGRDLPNATVQAVPDAGHAAPLDNPEYVTDALGLFLAAVTGRDATVGATAERDPSAPTAPESGDGVVTDD